VFKYELPYLGYKAVLSILIQLKEIVNARMTVPQGYMVKTLARLVIPYGSGVWAIR
jgi:hypothetical protein